MSDVPNKIFLPDPQPVEKHIKDSIQSWLGCDSLPTARWKTHVTIVKNCGKTGDGFIILSEILVELYFNNFKVKEVHSNFNNRTRGESSVNLKLIIDSFFGLLKIYKKKKKIVRKVY